MKLIYCTSAAFSNKLGNLVQVHSMAKEFQKKLGENFWLGVNYKNIDDPNIKIICFEAKRSHILAWRYLHFIRENQIDYIYCREARLLFFIILYNKLWWHMNLKFIYEIHALLARNLIDSLMDKALSFWVDKFIFVTKNLQQRFSKKYRINIAITIVCPDAVDLTIFNLSLSKQQARQQIDLPLDKKILVYTGKFKTMEMDKGIADILKSIKVLNDNDILFVAVGGSDKEIAHYQELTRELGVEKMVKLIGFSPQPKLAIFQKAADVLLMPFPYNEHYAFYMSPLKMFEYMASGRPIVATDLPSIKEILNDQSSILVRPGDPQRLVRGIKEALKPELSQKISQQAFQDVQNYTWEKRAEKILKFIQI